MTPKMPPKLLIRTVSHLWYGEAPNMAAIALLVQKARDIPRGQGLGSPLVEMLREHIQGQTQLRKPTRKMER